MCHQTQDPAHGATPCLVRRSAALSRRAPKRRAFRPRATHARRRWMLSLRGKPTSCTKVVMYCNTYCMKFQAEDLLQLYLGKKYDF